MKNKINIKINNKNFSANPHETILDVCLRNKIDIPHLCKHPNLSIQGNCRTCLVEVKDKGIVTSCSTQIEAGMQIKTSTPKTERARKTNLELIFAQHQEKCSTCLYQDNCVLLKYAEKYNLDIEKFFDRKNKYPIYQFGDAILFDSSKCIECRNCIEVCDLKQTCAFYEIVKDKGVETLIKPKGAPTCHSGLDPESQKILNPRLMDGQEVQDDIRQTDLLKNDENKFDCTYCGQCTVHCPVGAISGVPHWPQIEKLLTHKDSSKILVAQIAPSIRVSIGEEFNQPYGEIMTGQLATSMKQLGFDYAFDVNLGADLTTYEEARELAHWLTSNKPRPMFTSCCPAWVKFVEFFYPEFIKHLTSTNSPIMCSGPVLKTFFADKLKRDPRDIINVMIAPCTAKKHEAGLKKHSIDLGWCIERLNLSNIECLCPDRQKFKGIHVPAVDYVLTTREYAHLLRKHKINLPQLKPTNLDKPLGIYSGAAAIYGASGGVMESALRSADYFLRVLKETGSLKSILHGENYTLKKNTFSKIAQSRINFEEVRGMQGIKSANVKVADKKLKVAIVNGLGNARQILEDLKSGKVKYDYVEVMACPGGCIGGGGQPVPTNAEIRQQRAQALYEIDKNLPIRTAHENPSVLEIYSKYFKGEENLIEDILHSKFKSQTKTGYIQIKN